MHLTGTTTTSPPQLSSSGSAVLTDQPLLSPRKKSRTETSQYALNGSTAGGSLPMFDYNKNSQYQEMANSHSNFLLLHSAKTLASRFTNNEFHVADFGCSHGKNSMRCINAVFDGYAEAVEPEQNELFMTVYFNDLPTNDFTQVFKCLEDPKISIVHHPLFKEQPTRSLSTCINGKSFYTRCFPRDHLHLAYSFFCLHWMDQPIVPKDSIVTKSPGVSKSERLQLANIAHNELVKFIKLRSDELKRGGRLIVTLPKDSDMLAIVDSHWKDYLGQTSFTPDQFPSMVIPSYHRSDREIARALKAVSKVMQAKFVSSTGNPGAKFEVSTLRAATFNIILKGILDAQLFATNKQCVDFAEGFYSYLEPRWDTSSFSNDTHLIVLERI